MYTDFNRKVGNILIQEVYYSTLTKKAYKTKEAAERAEQSLIKYNVAVSYIDTLRTQYAEESERLRKSYYDRIAKQLDRLKSI